MLGQKIVRGKHNREDDLAGSKESNQVFIMKNIIASIMTAMLLWSCVSPVPLSLMYYHPDVEGGKLKQRDCRGDAGPWDKIIINGPNEVVFMAEAIPEEASTLLIVSIVIPTGKFVTFTDNIFFVRDESSNNVISDKISVVYPKEFFHFNYYGTRLPKKGISIFEELIGGFNVSPQLEKVGKPYAIFLELYDFKPKHFTLTIPKVMINGKSFQLPEISFRLKSGIYFYPINC